VGDDVASVTTAVGDFLDEFEEVLGKHDGDGRELGGIKPAQLFEEEFVHLAFNVLKFVIEGFGLFEADTATEFADHLYEMAGGVVEHLDGF
jgi:hypothetical protein